MGVFVMKWQPIETAPKDGTFILAINSDTRVPYTASYWGKVGNTEYNCYVQVMSRTDRDMKPTHWMKLPIFMDTDK